MASSSSSSSHQYDVFLSFRGSDTRRKFISHLYRELQSKVTTFKDDRVLQPGDSLPDELPEAIKESKIAVVVISEDYASSTWCLKELEMVMELNKEKTLDVFPIFYEVDPSDVRKQKGTFAKAFQKYEGIEKPEKVGKWREALTEVANLTGVVSRDWKEEADMVRYVGRDILKRLLAMPPGDTTDLIGMDTQLEALAPLLSLGSDNEVRMIGIWGMGGTGKTTIARYLFEKLSCQFQLQCFIENVKKIHGERGCENLRRQFLSQVLNDESLRSGSIKLNSNAIQDRLSSKKVLAILDDVDDLDQLEALAKQNSWFGPGTRIIITTRDEGLLISRKIKLVHEVKCLEHNTACRFFNHFAFSGGQVRNGFESLAVRASKLVGGLPLALKVLGLYLYGREIGEWKVALQRLTGDSRKIIMESLKVSYDGLTEQNKRIFLTVACLFDQERASHVSQLLDVDGEEWEVCDSLNKLAEKSLINISNDGNVTVHDLIHDMAKEIANSKPGRPRFLVDSNEIYKALARGMGNDAMAEIEGISLDITKTQMFLMGSKGFENLQNLKYLKIHNTCKLNSKGCSEIRAAINYLPRELRLLDWHGCPLTTLPYTFRAEFLVELRLPSSELENISEGSLFLGNLRRMDLNCCYNLKEIPTLYGATKLEQLKLNFRDNWVNIPSHLLDMVNVSTLFYCGGCENLKFLPSTTGLKSLKVVDLGGCSGLKSFPELPKSVVELYMAETSIREVPESIQNLVALEILDLSYCSELVEISSGIGNLTALKTLDLLDCWQLLKVPNTIGSLRSLEKLRLHDCKSLESLPDSISNLTGLKNLDLSVPFEIPNTIGDLTALTTLHLSCCEMFPGIPSSIGNLQSVKELRLSGCNSIPDTIGNLTALEELSLLCHELINIPSTLGNLSALSSLSLMFCENLLEIPSSIGNLQSIKEIRLENCNNLRNIPTTIENLKTLEILHVHWCEKLSNIPSTIGNLQSVKELHLGFCDNLRNIPDTIGDLSALTTLHVSSCEILWEIPSSIGNLQSVKKLQLSCCKNLMNIPDTVWNFTTLEELSLENYAKLTEIPSSIGNLLSAKKLSLSRCKNLKNIPDTIGKLTALEKLSLKGCCKLSNIPITIGKLTALEKLSLKGCRKLSNIPSTIGNLTALNTLDLSSCEMLSAIPSSIGNLTALETLELLDCKMLSDIPNTMGSLSSLKKLSPPPGVNCGFKILDAFCCGKQHFNASDIEELLSFEGMEVYCERPGVSHAIEVLCLDWIVCSFGVPSHCTSLSTFPHLRKLSLRNWNIQGISDDLGCLQTLQSLDLSGNIFEFLPKSITQLSLLEELVLSHCEDLRVMPELPQGVNYLYANGCRSLESVSNVSRHPFLRLMLHECFKLGQDPRLYIRHMISTPFRAGDVNAWACFSASEVPDCFYHRRKYQKLTTYCRQVDSNVKPVGFVAGVVVGCQRYWDMSSLSIQCHWQGKGFQFGHILVDFKNLPSHASFCGSGKDKLIVFSCHFGEEKSSDKISFYFDIAFEGAYFPGYRPNIKECGIHLCFTKESQRTRTLLTLGGGSCRQDIEENLSILLERNRSKQFEDSSHSSEEEEEGSDSENSSQTSTE